MTDPLKFTITFRLYPEDLGRIARMRTWGDEAPNTPNALHTDELLILWEGLTAGNDGYPDRAWASR